MCSSICLDLPGVHPAFCSVGTVACSSNLKRPRREVDHLSLSSFEVKKEWGYVSPPRVGHQVVYRDNFTVVFTPHHPSPCSLKLQTLHLITSPCHTQSTRSCLVHSAVNLIGSSSFSLLSLPYPQNMPLSTIMATLLQLLDPGDEGTVIL
jgi:hypothetical protein